MVSDYSETVQAAQAGDRISAAELLAPAQSGRADRYTKMHDIADRICKMRTARMRAMCSTAGLDPTLLGIHPHNAMCAYHDGRPWPGVDYAIVKHIDWLDRSGWLFEPYRVLRRWDARVR